MKNRNGTEGLTQKQVEALIADVVAIQKRIEASTVSLSDAERRATTKMRPGGETVVGKLVQLADQHGVALPDVTAASIAADLAVVQRLRPLGEVLRQVSQRVDDTIRYHQGACWWAATALYTALARIAQGNPEVEGALRPVVAFFALGSRKKAPAPQGTSPPQDPPAGTPPVKSAA